MKANKEIKSEIEKLANKHGYTIIAKPSNLSNPFSKKNIKKLMENK
jgi:hypothetical protein